MISTSAASTLTRSTQRQPISPAPNAIPNQEHSARMKSSVLLATLVFVAHLLSAEPFEFQPDDRVSLVGNTLADRMQHHGWLETILQTRFSDHRLVFRNLGFAADELNRRPRSQNFGGPDKHLAHSKTDVVFAFFGYNESFAGEEGLEAFHKELAAYVDHLLAQKYNGKSAPRVVLFSPIAHEDLKDPNLPDGTENNRRLALYTEAIGAVAEEKGVNFVDLFAPTMKLYEAGTTPLTINGIHLTEAGNRLLAEVIETELFGSASSRDEKQLEKVRAAVLDKNLHWFNYYRATDGYSQFGGRSGLRFVDGQTNRDVMVRELEILDVMTANRDKVVWASVKGQDIEADDSNTPAAIPVISNRKGSKSDGSHVFLSGEQAIEKMTIAKGMKVNLFASEETFPELINPVQSAVDTNGRLWVAAWPSYPHWNPDEELDDKLLILPDDDGDGRADRCITFAGELHNPTGFEFWNGGVLVAVAPDIVFLKDNDGDDKADELVRVLHGLDSADTHHTANSFVFGPGGWLYFQRGVFHVTNIESPWGPPLRSSASAMYRFNPLTHETEHYFNIGPNPHGIQFDEWGNHFASDGTSGNGFYVAFPRRGTPRQLYQKRYRPVPAIGLIGSAHFPEENRGNLLICNAIGFQGVAQLKFVHDGASIQAEYEETLLVSSDPNFRPADVEVGGDGALYVLDWQNPLIGHMQHNLRDPNRDHRHGRVYRITAEGRELLKPVKLIDRPIDELLEHLDSTTFALRYRTRLELSGRDSQAVTSAAAAWAEPLSPDKASDARKLTEALWLHQAHRVVNVALLRKVLKSVDHNARAAATRVVRDWVDKIPDVGSLLLTLAADEHPKVRAEAVIASTYYKGADAAEIIFEAEQWPTDVQLSFNLNEAKKNIDVDAYVKHVIDAAQELTPAAYAYVLRNASVENLLALERTEPVYREILSRSGVTADHLRDALQGLAKIEEKPEASLLLELVQDLDSRGADASYGAFARLLAGYAGTELKGSRDRLQSLAANGQTADVRRMGYAAWIAADGSAAAAIRSAGADKRSIDDLLEAVRLLAPNEAPDGLYEQLRPFLFEIPGGLGKAAGGAQIEEPGIRVEYFQPHPPSAKLEAFKSHKPKAAGVVDKMDLSAPQIKLRDAFALRFTTVLRIDEPGRYRFFTNSDDGSCLYVGGELVVDNDGNHGMVEKRGDIRLEAGSHPLVVTYYDNGGGDGLAVSWSGPGFKKQRIPLDRLTLAGEDTLHDVAIRAIAHLPGDDTAKFRDFAKVVAEGRQQKTAVAALSAIAQDKWPADALPGLARSLAKHVSEIPAKYRTSKSVVAALELGDAVAARLPEGESRRFRAEIAELAVQIIRLGTIPERMIYDKERLAVQAGRHVGFVFANTDNMPHNFAVTLPGALEEVGLLAEETAQDKDAEARHYIPKSDKILVASKLLQPGQTQAFGFDVPNAPGIYPYVCTYPGHWRRMYGALYVVADLKSYLKDPEAYLKEHPLELKDELLKYNERNKEWDLADLAPSVKEMHGGRSFEVGQKVFDVASCVSCHSIGGKGQNIGPDLTKLDAAKSTRDALLESILVPSKQIDDKFRSYAFVLSDGETVTGMIVEETPSVVNVAFDPLGKAAPREIARTSILARTRSDVSLMPLGLLNKLSREEILDLLAFVIARGDRKHMLFEEHKH